MDINAATETAYRNGYEAGKPKWIPAGEGLPDEFVGVLIHTPLEVPLPTVKEAYRVGEDWISMVATYHRGEVTHWMPLPEPPTK